MLKGETAAPAPPIDVTSSSRADAGIMWAIVGHSDRRNVVARESDELVAEKTKAVVKAGMMAVLCVGELKDERQSGRTIEVVTRQLAPVVAALEPAEWSRVVLAYEPVWAIGTGLTATPQQAQDTHAELRAWLASQLGADVAGSLRIAYGGSVKASNCRELIGMPDIDGFLVGGASITPEFVPIIASVPQQQ